MGFGRRLTAIIAPGLAAAVLAAGCGGSSAPLSTQELIAKGDALCQAEQQKFTEVQAEAPANASDAADQTGELADAAGSAFDGLDDLTPPAQLKQAYDGYLDSMRQARDLLDQGRDAADQQDAAAYAKAQAELAAHAKQRRKRARAVGFKTCSEFGG
ncbi:MAG: hypothetical protein ABR536_04540 [Solirubrobacterales bacterium]